MLTGLLWSAGTPASFCGPVLTGAYSTLGFDADGVVAELLGVGLGHSWHPSRPAPRGTSIINVTYSCTSPLEDIGVETPHRNTIDASLARCVDRDYRTEIAIACWRHATADDGPGAALVLYDLTTLYFEAEKEDGLRKVGMSKERPVGPQITVGLLVARDAFPLDIHFFEGNKAEPKTQIPAIIAFQERQSVTDTVVVADAGMPSAANLNALEDAGLSFIVTSRTSKAPKEL